MLILGAGGHALEVLEVLDLIEPNSRIVFFEDVVTSSFLSSAGDFTIVHAWTSAAEVLAEDPRFILGLGGPCRRKRMTLRAEGIGGTNSSLISPMAVLGSRGVFLDEGVSVMSKSLVSGDVHVGEGALLNAGCQVHHGSRIGSFSEISPGAILLGGAIIGKHVQVGAGAVVMPGTHVGNHSVVGAGAIVTRDVPDFAIMMGVPARQLGENDTICEA